MRLLLSAAVLAACTGKAGPPAGSAGRGDARGGEAGGGNGGGGGGAASGAVAMAPDAAAAALAGTAARGGDGGDACDGQARSLGPGLTHERWAVDAVPAVAVPPCVDIVRADLRHHALRIVTSTRDGDPRPAPRWMEDLSLVAAINAGMFHEGGTSVGMLIDGDHENQPRDNKKLGGYLAFDPRDPAAAPVVITGKDCPGFDLDALRTTYRSVTQSYRMLGCSGEALAWADPKHYSAAAIGLDRDGRVVLIHARAPFLMRDLSRALARPELRLAGALFVEGGPEATVAVDGAAGHLLRVGSYETGFVEDDGNDRAWDVPNLIALSARAKPAAGAARPK